MATLIGVVSQVIGEVYAVAGDGTRRPLSEGDRVFAGERIVTGPSGAISVAMSNGQLLTLGRESSLSLNEQMLADSSNQSSPSEQVPAETPSDSDLTDVERLQAAIEAGVDPTLEGEATAAGPGAGGAPGAAGGGHSFVLLGETAGALEPIIGFPTAGLSSGPEFPDPEPAVADDAPEFSPTVGIIYFDQEGSVVAGPGVVEEAALNPDAPTNLDGQAGSNPGSNAENVSGSLVINSPDGISAIQVLDKDGVWINVQGGGVVQGIYGQLVFDAAGNWTYILADNTLNHSIPDAVGADDQILDPFSVRVVDGDGDVSPATPLTIAIYDDGPSILRFDISEQSSLLVVDESVGTGGSIKDEPGQAQNNDESGYAGSETGVIGYASFNLESIFSLAVDPGADGENLEAREFSLTLSEDGVDSGLTATAGGPILLSFVGGDGTDAGDILGIADGGLVVFRISIDPSTGAVSVTQYAAVDHGSDGNNHDSMAVIDEDRIGVTVKIYDNDGDSATSTSVELGSRIGFEDDGPLAQLSAQPRELGTVLVDESLVSLNGVQGDGIPSAVLSAAIVQLQFDSAFGADGAAAGDDATVYSLELSGANVPSGLYAVDASAPLGQGEQIVLNQLGNVITGSAGGAPYFTLTIDPVSGEVTLDLLDNIWHDDTADADDSEVLSLAEGALLLTQTVTDGDGDSDSVSIDLGAAGAFSFEDDGPLAQLSEQPRELGTVRVDESLGDTYTDGIPSAVLSAAIVQSQFDSAFGADGAAAGDDATVYSLELSGADVLSGLYAVDASAPLGQGEQIVLNQLGNVITGSAGGVPYFTLTIDPVSGEVTLDLLDNIWHDDTADADDSEVLSLGDDVLLLTQTVTDGDGDSDSVSIDLGAAGVFSFEDDGPVADIKIVSGVRVVHDESQGLQNATATPTPPRDANDNDVRDIATLFSSVTNKGGDLLPEGYAQSSEPLVSTAGSDSGQDQEGATSILSLAIVGGNGVASGLMTTAGYAINLSVENYLVVGRVVGGPDAGKAAFAIAIGDDGTVSVAQYVSLQHPISGSNYDEAISLAGKIQAVVTVTDGDGDVAVDKVNIGSAIRFEDDGPTALLSVVSNAGVTHDESHGLQNATETPLIPGDANDNDVADLSALFASLDTLGTDINSLGTDLDPIGYAQSSGSVVSAAGSSTGQDDEGATSELSLALQGGDGMNSGLRTTDGTIIRLFLEGDLIVGRVNGFGKAAFAVAIDGDGKLSVAQYMSLRHPDGSSADEALDLSGKIKAVLTITDGDGDVAVDKVDIGHLIRFEDDAPTAGQTIAAVVLDDEGLAGGINGGLGDATGAETSTSGNLVFAAGADGLKSIVLSGPAILGSEDVTSTWAAGSKTLTISSARGALITVQLTDLASGAYTVNLLQPLMHLPGGDENDIILNIGYTVTDGDNDSATGSLVVAIDDDTPTIQAGSLGVSSFVTFQGTDAGFSNSYGYYNKAPDGSPVDGKVIWANVHAQSVGDVADLSGLDPANTGFFIIPNGGANAGLSNGSVVTFELVSGQWQATVGGVPLVGADGANVLFSDASLNPGGSHLQDTGNAGNQNWEDKTLTSDYDYNDVSTNVTWGTSLQVDESDFSIDATANFSGVFNVQPGADGQQSLTYELSVQNANSGLVDTETNEAVILSFNAGVIEGRTSVSDELVFTLSVNAAGTVKLDQLRAIVHPTGDPDEAQFLGAGHVGLGATVTDGDGDQASANIDIGTAISFKDDGPSVQSNELVQLDDDALANGIPDGIGDDGNALNISGTLALDFGADGAGSVQWLTTDAPTDFTYTSGPGGSLLISQGATLVLTVTLNSSSGAYTVTQNAPILHADADQENNQAFTLNYRVTDKDGDTADGVLAVNVDDDTPLAQNDVAYVSTGQSEDINIVFVLDFSGSIDDGELNQMLDAVRTAGQELFNSATGAVQLQIVAFSDDSIGYPVVTDITSFTSLVNSLNPLEAGGVRPLDSTTDFTDAIQQTMVSYVPQPGWSNQVVFISDGNPNEQTGTGGNSLRDATAAAWNTFVNSNGITVTTIGVGGGIIDQRLEDVDLDAGPNNDPLRVDDFDELVDTLLDSVIGGTVNGNVLQGSDGVVGGGDDDGYGADGPGRIMSIEINGTTYNWDGVLDGDQVLSDIPTTHGGKLDFNFATGAWTYRASSSGGGDQVETFNYVIIDKDGDPSQATLSVYVDDISPVIAKVDEDELSGGITDSDGETTIATGSVSSLVVGPSTGVQFILSGNTSGLAGASSGGTPLVYSVVGDTLSAKAGAVTVFTLQVESDGDYTFTLLKPLDHSLGNGDDGELLVMDFASILQASNGVDPVSLAGSFLVQIEDDVPTVSANAPVQLDDDALAGGIAGGPNGTDDADSVNTGGTLNHNFGADGAGTVKWLDSGAPGGFTYQASPDGSQLLVKQGGTTVLTLTLNTATGVYNVTQNAPIQHANADLENNQAFTLNYQVTDKDGDKAEGSLSINVDDDTPLAQNDTATVVEGSGGDFNVAFVLDSSGSISNSEFTTMMNAVMAGGQALFNGTSGDVKITIVAFSSDSLAYAPVTKLAAFEALVDNIIANRPFSGSTDFTDAVEQTMVSFSPTPGWDNQVFFISDGNPNQQTGTGGNSLEDDVADDWADFLASGGINVTTIGVGGGVNEDRLEDVDLDSDPDKTPILVNEFDDLIDALLGQITGGGLSGNVLLGDDNALGGVGVNADDAFGADGPASQPIVAVSHNGVVYTTTSLEFSGDTLTIDTQAGGSLSINFSTGVYTYNLGQDVADDLTETFSYTIQDADGDQSTATLSLTTIDSSEVGAFDSYNQAIVSQVEVPGAETSRVLANFSDTTNGSNSGAGYNPWTFDTSNTGQSVLVNSDVLSVAGNKWGVTALGRNGVEVNSGELRLTDSSSSNSTSTKVATPTFTVDAGDTATLSFEIDEVDNFGNGDRFDWELLRYNSGTSSWDSVQDGSHSINTGSTDVTINTASFGSGVYRMYFQANDRSNNNDSYRIKLDNITLMTLAAATLVTHVSAVSGNVLTDPNNYIASSDPWGAVDDKGAEGAALSIWDGSSYVAIGVGTAIAGAYGSLVISDDGSYTYTPDADMGNIGKEDMFSYMLTQPDGDTASAHLVVKVGGSAYVAPNVVTGSGDLVGTDGSDVLIAGDGGHTLDGGAGSDRLEGGNGSDNLLGGLDDDFLIGGAGDDTLTGGAGNDTFIWKAGDTGHDVVMDFGQTAGDMDALNLSELLDFSGTANSANLLGSYIDMSFSGGNTLVEVSSTGDLGSSGADQTITLAGVDLSAGGSLSTADIIDNMLGNGTLAA
ncbi:MAG: retention module-containing protein [Gammaproteobacteria bacterium]|nr:retention module-containing protein [Gammaproteobacteria bacterium]MBU0881907.1 retention module-containing protein [Gammaproteobacteria bacterium]MBU1859792.1 retention module-containing protein [Gammaproteobacteria bacterium]